MNIFPKPLSVTPGTGQFDFRGQEIMYNSPAIQFEAEYLADMVGSKADEGGDGRVRLVLDGGRSDLGTEGYALSVKPDSVTVTANTSAGIFYGVQTIRQLLPASIEEPGPKGDRTAPCVEIVDKPRFGWRGMLLDVSRHFFPKPDIEHFLDLLAMQKMNVFHWHLVDDGGWRIEIKKYPLLTEKGAWRKWSPGLWDYQHLSFPGTSSGDRVYGGFYTQDDIREIVKYAADRHITIVPEIEMPGHSLAAMESYPMLTCSIPAGEYQKHTGMPFPNVYCAGKETTFTFIQNVLDEVCDLFPSKFVHIGGDEVDKYAWSNCADCIKRMEDENLKNPEELQSYFIRRVEKYLNSKGKRLIGWDEILEGGLAPNAAVMSWRGIDGGIAAAKANHDVVMTPTSHCYFDYSYNDTSTEHVLSFEPVPAALTSDQGTRILGGQCNLWTEWVPDRSVAEQRLFPRILSMSEVLWSDKAESPDAFDARLEAFYPRLDALHLNYYVPKPQANTDAVLLNGSAEVTFKQPPMPDSEIRYTTDGSEPDMRSAVYRGPIKVDHPESITAAIFKKGGAKSDSVHIQVSTYAAAHPSSVAPGLTWNVYDGNFTTVPNFTGLTSVANGTSTDIGLVGNKLENYAIQFNGYIKIDKDGIYTFHLSSDDGSVLWLGGAKLIDNDGLHGAVDKAGTISLKAGTYAFGVGYIQAGGAQSLKVGIEGPGLTPQAIPAGMLWH